MWKAIRKLCYIHLWGKAAPSEKYQKYKKHGEWQQTYLRTCKLCGCERVNRVDHLGRWTWEVPFASFDESVAENPAPSGTR